MSLRDALSIVMFDIFFHTAIHVVRVRVSKDPYIVRVFAHLDEDLKPYRGSIDALTCGQRAVWAVSRR